MEYSLQILFKTLCKHSVRVHAHVCVFLKPYQRGRPGGALTHVRDTEAKAFSASLWITGL